MKSIVIALFCVLLTSACSKNDDAIARDGGYPPPDVGPQMAVPPFEIKITVSEAHTKQLRDEHKSIKGIVMFDGNGTSRKNEYTAPMPAVVLGFYQFETQQTGIVEIGNATISKETFTRLSDTDYYYTVNVYCKGGGYADGHISEASKHPIEIGCY